MIDGTGMCGGCRFSTLDGDIQYACVDGPDVDGHNIDFNNLLQRATTYCDEESECLETYDHACLLNEKVKDM
jgi:ferredoxin--NADP+ reductase